MLRTIRPKTLLMIGTLMLAIASTGSWYLRLHSHLPTDWVDGLSGFLYGVAIPTTLLAVWRYKRAPR